MSEPQSIRDLLLRVLADLDAARAANQDRQSTEKQSMAFRHGKPQRLRRDPSRWQSDEPRPNDRWQNFAPRDRLHELRAKVHREFDPLWRSQAKRKFQNRPAAYAWLAGVLGLDREAHVSEFDEAMCERALVAIRSIR